MNWGVDREKECYLCRGTGWLKCLECNVGYGEHLGECKHCRGNLDHKHILLFIFPVPGGSSGW
jgi:hypothetical protein